MTDRSELLDLLLEVQTFDRLPRTGYSMRGVTEPESLSEHSWQVTFLVWTAGQSVPELNRGRALELALSHDIAELRVGDIPRISAHYFPQGAKATAEEAATEDLLAPLGDYGSDAFAEFEAGTSTEARFVRACDQLQLLLKAAVYESQNNGDLRDFWERNRGLEESEFDIIRQLYSALLLRRQTTSGRT